MEKDRLALGIRLYNEHFVAEEAGDLAGAQEKLRRSAALGEPMAKHALALEMRTSDPATLRRSIRLYREAAQAGFAPSAWNLARHYESKENKAAYLRWLRRAADIGDPDASVEMHNPGPYLLKHGVQEYNSNRHEEGERIVRKVASWGNEGAKKQLKRWGLTA